MNKGETFIKIPMEGAEERDRLAGIKRGKVDYSIGAAREEGTKTSESRRLRYL